MQILIVEDEVGIAESLQKPEGTVDLDSMTDAKIQDYIDNMTDEEFDAFLDDGAEINESTDDSLAGFDTNGDGIAQWSELEALLG